MAIYSDAPSAITSYSCHHCGNVFQYKPIKSTLFQEKNFCCTGCKSVYELLEDKGLCQYYQLNNHQGQSFAEMRADLRFGFLDEPTVANSLLSFQSNERAVVNFHLPQMHCSACIYLLEHFHKLVPGVLACRVDFPKRQWRLDFDPRLLSVRTIVETLTTVGYEPQLNMAFHEQKASDKEDKHMLYRIGIAGFCFGNLMLLGFPEYLAENGLNSPLIERAISILNVLLIIPVVTYVAKDYYVSAWAGLKQRTLNIDIPISLGILALFFQSLYETLTATGPGYFDSFGGLLFFLMIGKYLQRKTFDKLSFEHDYRSFFPLASMKIVNGKEESVNISQLIPGDHILVRNEEIVPADSVLISDKTLMDYSFVTGESHPVEKFRGDILFAGGKVIGGAVEAEVLKPSSQSYLTQLWNDEAFKKAANQHYKNITDRISIVFTPLVLFLAIGGFAFWSFTSIPTAITVLVSVLIIACPCALALSAPFTYSTMMHRFGLQHLYLKNPDVIDRLTRIDTIVLDKTGTLTHTDLQTIDSSQLYLNEEEKDWVKTACRNSTHPLSKLLYQHLSGNGNAQVDLFDEIKGRGISAVINGHSVTIGSRSFVMEGLPQTGSPGLTTVYLAVDQVVRGYVCFTNAWRNGLEQAAALLSSKYRVIILSGDNDSEAPRLRQMFGAKTVMYFNQSPTDKLNRIQQLQSLGYSVLMVGDGLNDAGALKKAEVGMAVAEDSTQFSPASDAILEGTRVPHLPQLLNYARSSRIILSNNLCISLAYNVVGLSFALSGSLSPLVSAIMMPLSTITVVSLAVSQAHYRASKLDKQLLKHS